MGSKLQHWKDDKGNMYVFKPGKDGSYTRIGKWKPPDLSEAMPTERKARFISSGREQEELEGTKRLAQAPQPEKMAYGGIVGDDEKLKDDLTQGTSAQTPPVPLPEAPVGPQQSAPVQTPPPMMQKAPVAATPPMTPPSPKLPGMPEGVTPADIEGYLNRQRADIQRFGAADQMALQNQLNERRGGLRYRATEGLKGLADAVMMGVAGAGNPGWQQQFKEGEQQFAKDQMETLRGARSANIQDVQARMSFDQMDPKSTLSKVAQQSFGPLFKKLGYPTENLGGMSAANIENALSLMTQYGGKEIEAILRGQEFKLAMMQYEEAKRHNEELEALQARDDKRAAAQEVLDSSSRFNPFRMKQRAAAKDVLAQMATEEAGANTLSSRDQEALAWANANPTDERAIKIKARLGQ